MMSQAVSPADRRHSRSASMRDLHAPSARRTHDDAPPRQRDGRKDAPVLGAELTDFVPNYQEGYCWLKPVLAQGHRVFEMGD